MMHMTFESFQDFVKARYPQAKNFHELDGYSCVVKGEHNTDSINYSNCIGWYVARVTAEESYRGTGPTLDSAIKNLQLTFTSPVPTPGGTRDIQKILECLDAFTTTVVEVLDAAGYGNQYLNATLAELNKAITDYDRRQSKD